MPTTYKAIATVTVGAGGTSSIDFSAIPSTYTDLVLAISARTNKSGTSSDLYVQFNGVTTATYSFRRLYGDSGNAVSDSLTNNASGGFVGLADGSTATSSTFGNVSVYIPNYTGSNAKSWSADAVMENNATTLTYLGIYAGLWSGTNAITSISIKEYNGNNFVQYTTATLYGIKNS